MEEGEKQRMEDFVRELFSKTEDFNQLTKKIVRRKYIQHSQKDGLNAQEKSVFGDIIVRMLFEFNVGTNEKSGDKNERSPIVLTPLAAEKRKPNVCKEELEGSIYPQKLSQSTQESQRKALLSSKTDSHPKRNVVKEAENAEPNDGEEGKEEGKDKSSKNLPRRVIEDSKDKKRSFVSLHPAKRVLSRQILINNLRYQVKKTTPSKFILVKPPDRTSQAASEQQQTPTDDPLASNLAGDRNRIPSQQEAQDDKEVPSIYEQAKNKSKKPIPKRLSAFEVLQSVFEDSNDGSVLSKSDVTDDDRGSAIRSSPICDSLGDQEDSLIPLDEISDSTPIRCRPGTKRRLETDTDSVDGFTPPTKIKRVIGSDSDSKNSPIRMRLFRNRIIDYSLNEENATGKKRAVIESDVDSQSPFKPLAELELSTSDNNSLLSSSPLVRAKEPSKRKGKSRRCLLKGDESEERKTVKPFRISISKREILKDSDSDAQPPSPRTKGKKRKLKRKKNSSSRSKSSNGRSGTSLSSSSTDSSSDSDDLKLSQLKLMNQKKMEDTSDSDSELLINYAANRPKNRPPNNFKEPHLRESPVFAGTQQPKIRIIHEKSAMDSDSDSSSKRLSWTPLQSSVGKVKIIRENAVVSENDSATPINIRICDTAQLSSPDETPEGVRRKFRQGQTPWVLNSSDSDSDLGLRMMASDSSDSEDESALKNQMKRKVSSLISVSNPLRASSVDANGLNQSSLSDAFLSASEYADIPFTAEDIDAIDAAVAYAKSLTQSKKRKRQRKAGVESNESSHVDVEDTSNETDDYSDLHYRPSSYSNNNKDKRSDKNAVHLEKDNNFMKNWKSKRLIVRVERIKADSLGFVNSNCKRLALKPSSCHTVTPDDCPSESRSPKPNCNGISSDSDSGTSSLSDLTSNDSQGPAVNKKAVQPQSDSKSTSSAIAVPVESNKLKHLKKVCRAAQLFVNYKKEFLEFQTDQARCQRLQKILKDAGMKGRPTFKAAERIRLLREAKELNEDNIISCDSGRTRSKVQEPSGANSSKNTIEAKAESFTNLVGIVDSERSESEKESNW